MFLVPINLLFPLKKQNWKLKNRGKLLLDFFLAKSHGRFLIALPALPPTLPLPCPIFTIITKSPPPFSPYIRDKETVCPCVSLCKDDQRLFLSMLASQIERDITYYRYYGF